MLHTMGQTARYPVHPSLMGSGSTASAILDLIGELIGPLDKIHLLLIGAGTLELMCDAIHLNCLSVAAIRSHEMLEPDSADVVYISANSFIPALSHIRRALHPGGQLIIQLRDESGTTTRILQSLRLQGFVGERTIPCNGKSHFIVATRPVNQRRVA